MGVNSGLLTPVSLPIDKESVDILNRQLQKSWLIEGIMGHFYKMGKCDKSGEKMFPTFTLLGMDLYSWMLTIGVVAAMLFADRVFPRRNTFKRE